MYSLGIVDYPKNIVCDCGLNVVPNRKTIDIITWDLKCKCGKIAYFHPKREERKNQISNMLD